MATRDSLVEKVEVLEKLLVANATGSNGNERWNYPALRKELLQHPLTKHALPPFVLTCRDLGQFWQFIKREFGTYAERREFIWGQFRPLLESLESKPDSLVQLSEKQILARLSTASVESVWQRALERRILDPEGAITSARTLLETVCKHILDDLIVSYDDNSELPKLYGLTAEALQLSPSQHTEKVFKQILGGCMAVVEGLGALRSRLGDAHGGGRDRVKPAARHAELAVNLAGSVASFLVTTWEARKPAK